MCEDNQDCGVCGWRDAHLAYTETDAGSHLGDLTEESLFCLLESHGFGDLMPVVCIREQTETLPFVGSLPAEVSELALLSQVVCAVGQLFLLSSACSFTSQFENPSSAPWTSLFFVC